MQRRNTFARREDETVRSDRCAPLPLALPSAPGDAHAPTTFPCLWGPVCRHRAARIQRECARRQRRTTADQRTNPHPPIPVRCRACHHGSDNPSDGGGAVRERRSKRCCAVVAAGGVSLEATDVPARLPRRAMLLNVCATEGAAAAVRLLLPLRSALTVLCAATRNSRFVPLWFLVFWLRFSLNTVVSSATLGAHAQDANA